MQYCLNHLLQLFEEGKYDQAVNTTFVTQTTHQSWQMIAVFCVVFAILIVSVVLMCVFMRGKNKKKRAHDSSEDNIDTSF